MTALLVQVLTFAIYLLAAAVISGLFDLDLGVYLGALALWIAIGLTMRVRKLEDQARALTTLLRGRR